MKTLRFKKLRLKNFLSVGSTPLEFEFLSGLNLITGHNRDIPDEKNGIGKCLDPETQIEISINDKTVLEKYVNFLKENSKSSDSICKYLHEGECEYEAKKKERDELGIVDDKNKS